MKHLLADFMAANELLGYSSGHTFFTEYSLDGGVAYENMDSSSMRYIVSREVAWLVSYYQC